MISCDECQKRIVAFFDNEGSKGYEKLIDVHLKDCSECRAFREGMVKLRQQFVSVDVPSLPESVRREVMQLAHADSRRRENRTGARQPQKQSFLMRYPRLVWASGFAAMFLIAISWIVSFNLAKKVEVLKQELENSKQEIALAKEKEQLEEAQDRQQKAISALYFRMQELEQRVDRSGPPRPASFPVEHNGL